MIGPWLRPAGDDRVAFVWRLYGWAGVQQLLLLGGDRSWGVWFSDSPAVVHGFTVCSLLLLVFGARPASWAITGVVTGALLWITASGRDRLLDFPGAELPIFFALPAASLVAWWLARGRAEGEETRALLWVARVVFLVEMGFAALHKANRDFFDPSLSCAFVLSEMVPQWWDTPVAALAHLLTPPVVLALEAAIPLLVIVYWPLGLLLMLGFLAGLAAVGPTGFTGVTIAAGFSFLRGTTAGELLAPMRARPWASAAGGVALAAYVAWAHRAPPDHPPAQFVLYFLVVAALALMLAGALARDVSRRPPFPRLLASLEWPRAGALRVVLVVLAVVGILDGLTPYFGYKYHFSFSMLSNLRADGLRWNSLVVPRALRMVDADPFVRVTRVRIRRQGGRPTDPDRELFEGYFPPYEFVRRVDYHLRHGHEVHAWIEWEGQERFLPRIGHNPEARAFLDALPRALLFQTVITAGPQPCVH